MRTRLRSKVTLLFMMLGMLLAVPAVAFAADGIIADGDTVTAGEQASRDLGVVGPGATVKVGVAPNDAKPKIDFNLDCNGNNHFNSGEQATIAFNSAGSSITDANNATPATGSLTATSLTNISGPASWPADGTGCGNPEIAHANLGSSEVTIVAPNSAGTYTYKVAYTVTRGTGTDPNELSTSVTNLPVTFTLKVDATKPTITLTTPPDGATYDLNESVNASYTCQDETGGSGIKSCVGDVANGTALDTSTAGAHTFTVNAEDKAGNKESVTHNYTVVNPDSVAPTSAATASVPDGDDAGTDPDPYTSDTWTNKNVTVSLSASDNSGGSGVKKLVYSATGADPIAETTDNTAPFTASLLIDAEGTTTVSFHAEDNNGNVEDTQTFVVKIDKTAPTVNCGSADGVWHANDVSIACTANDTGGSGLANAADGSFNLTTNVANGTETNNAPTNSRDVADAVGNTATAGPIAGNKVDKKDPAVNCGSADGNWHANDVSIACTASDGGSGLADSADATFDLTTNVASGTETNNASTGTHDVSDAVGHTVTAGPIAGNKVDKKDPTFSCPAADSDWHATNPAFNCTASDGGSGLNPASDSSFQLATNVADDNENANASTGTKTLTDGVGHTTIAGPITGVKVDRKDPAVNCGSADGNWHANDVSIACTASDSGSGLANTGDASFSLSTSVAAGTETANASTNSKNVADAVGNSSQAGPISGNKVDKKAPTFDSNCPAGGPFTQNSGLQSVGPIGATDGGSGLDNANSTLSGSVDTSTIGSKTVTFTAKDNVANSNTKQCTYSVIYKFDGFRSPVDNPGTGTVPVFNSAKAGQSIPVKFSLFGNQGLNILDGAPRVTSVNCTSAATVDPLEEYATTTANNGLTYDATADQYNYVWKTQSNYGTKCFKFDMVLIDQTHHVAYFKFLK